MTTYTIENESNNLIGHLSEQDADVVTGAKRFSSEEELANLAASWPTARLVAIFNGLPGVTPVKKFTDRKTAITRIWNAVQAFDLPTGTVAEPATSETPETEEAQKPETTVEPEPTTEQEPTATPEAAQAPDVAPVEAESPKKTTHAEKTPAAANGSREGSKTATVLELMKREGGVTAKELMSVTGWQAHSVRGFISGTLGKKMGLTVVSTRGENGERTYTIQG